MTQNNGQPYKGKRNVTTDFAGMGKLPPQATDLEEAILGALMLEKVSMNVWNSLKAEYFYRDNHQKIYQAIATLREDRTPVDILTVTAQLRKVGELEMIGGAYYITELTSRVSGSSNIEFHIKIVHQKYLSRSLIQLATEVINTSYDDTGNPFDDMNKLVTHVDQLKRDVFKRSEKNIGQLMIEAGEERYREKINGLLGVTTGLKGIDHITQGDQAGQIRIIAARPAMGKSAVMCSEMLACVFDMKQNKFLPKGEAIPVGCFSLEMSGVSLGFRMLSAACEVSTKRIKINDLTNAETLRVDDFADMLAEQPVYIDDTPGLSIDEFETKAALWVALYGVRKIYIDYLQLMKGRSGKKYANREAEVSDISRCLKIVAKELGITIIALCQLSRSVETRKNCMPILSDLRESGAIEQDADIVEFLWRPEYYPEVMATLTAPGGGIDIRLFGFSITEFEGVIIGIIAKCREEETGKVPMRFKGVTMRVSDHPQVLYALEAKQQNQMFNPEQREATF